MPGQGGSYQKHGEVVVRGIPRKFCLDVWMETAAVTGLVSESGGIVDNVAATPNVALASTTTTTTAALFLEERRSCKPSTLQV